MTTPEHWLAQRRPATALSVVIPCYNEADNLELLYGRVTACCEAVVGQCFELLLVDDGSTDATWSLIQGLADRDHRVVGIALSRNYGHQPALSAGLRCAVGQRILVLDADLQDPPELLATMMAKMDGGADVVYGQRQHRRGETAFKRWTAKAFYRLFNHLVDTAIPLDSGDFRLMSRRVVDHLNQMPEQHRFIRGMVSWIGFRQEALPYERQPRHAGVTKYNLQRMLGFATDAITGFSIRPLKLAAWLGGGFGILGFIGALYAMVAWALGATVPGWTSVIVVVLIMGGVQLLVMGLFGEYLGRLYIEAKGRPLYIIGAVTQRGDKAPASGVQQPTERV